MKNNLTRCKWPGNNEISIKYHDSEWGFPIHKDDLLFEYLILDTFQAGLSWQIILNKRKNFQKAFHNFDVKKISNYSEKDRIRLLNDVGIVRNRLKIKSAITNAQKFLEVQKEFGSFDKYIWQFTNYKTLQNNFKKMTDLPSKTFESDEMSKDLKKRGFKFCGSTICYAFMQAIGMVNDHTTDCFRYNEVKI
ncbi:TPA: DNA-3-methyladenine glycosylase I [Candidatus Pacearchaeota archaeon]|jgi:DNA-3-methyladenine glycosylase I|nr:DNA-3-methyladenine glycosylase I [Candidatus Pacearchaeota archaeon]